MGWLTQNQLNYYYASLVSGQNVNVAWPEFNQKQLQKLGCLIKLHFTVQYLHKYAKQGSIQ